MVAMANEGILQCHEEATLLDIIFALRLACRTDVQISIKDCPHYIRGSGRRLAYSH